MGHGLCLGHTERPDRDRQAATVITQGDNCIAVFSASKCVSALGPGDTKISKTESLT